MGSLGGKLADPSNLVARHHRQQALSFVLVLLVQLSHRLGEEQVEVSFETLMMTLHQGQLGLVCIDRHRGLHQPDARFHHVGIGLVVLGQVLLQHLQSIGDDLWSIPGQVLRWSALSRHIAQPQAACGTVRPRARSVATIGRVLVRAVARPC